MQTKDERRGKQRRAEREIYRPGALRMLKEIASLQSVSSIQDKKDDCPTPTVVKNSESSASTNSTSVQKNLPNVSNKQKNQMKYPISSSDDQEKSNAGAITGASIPNNNNSKKNQTTFSKKTELENVKFSQKSKFRESKQRYIDSDKFNSNHVNSTEKIKIYSKTNNGAHNSLSKYNDNINNTKLKMNKNTLIDKSVAYSNNRSLTEKNECKLKDDCKKQGKFKTPQSEIQEYIKESQQKNRKDRIKIEQSKEAEKNTANIFDSSKPSISIYSKEKDVKNKHIKMAYQENRPQKKKDKKNNETTIEKSKEKCNNFSSKSSNYTNKSTVCLSEKKEIDCNTKVDKMVQGKIRISNVAPISVRVPKLTEKIDQLSDETSSENESNIGKSPQTSPIIYTNCFKNNSFYENTHDIKNATDKPHLKNIQNSQNVMWDDEKWSLSQRQRKRKGKIRDYGPSENIGRRGIIQMANSPTHLEPSSEIVTPGQRLLFNPDNPSKPVAVMPSARDLHPSRESFHAGIDKDKTLDEATTEPNLGEFANESEGSSTIDPSIFYSIQKGELDINYFVNSNQLPQEFRRIMDIRIHLQSCYKQLLISDIRLCQEKNVEGALWKSLYYIIIEKLREYINCEPTLKERSQSTLMMIVEEGLVYFQSLLTAIQKAYRFTLEAHFEEDLLSLPGTKNRVRQALNSCQKILLSLGDLARYREQYNPVPNYSHAKK